MVHSQISVCEVCTLQYDETCTIPLSLPCGHSFCKPCITEVLRNNPTCPICRKFINKSINELPKNYSLLRVSLSQNYTSEIQRLKKILSKQLEDISNIFSNFSTILAMTQANLSIIEEINESDKPDKETEFRKIIDRIEEDYLQTEEILRSKNFQRETRRNSHLQNTNVNQGFFQNIYNRVESGEELFTFHQMKNEIKFGKISVQENMILFHCLDLSDVPTTSFLIRFENLKENFPPGKICPFIKLTCNENATCTIFIEMFKKKKRMTNPFINLCTGERGPSYKYFTQIGFSNERRLSKYYHQQLLDVLPQREFGQGFEKDNYDYDYLLRDGVQTLTNNTVVVEGFEDAGYFSLVSSVSDCLMNIYCGKVIYPNNLTELLGHDNVPQNNILDCGIMIST